MAALDKAVAIIVNISLDLENVNISSAELTRLIISDIQLASKLYVKPWLHPRVEHHLHFDMTKDGMYTTSIIIIMVVMY